MSRKSNKKYVYIGGVILVILALAVFAYFYMSNTAILNQMYSNDKIANFEVSLSNRIPIYEQTSFFTSDTAKIGSEIKIIDEDLSKDFYENLPSDFGPNYKYIVYIAKSSIAPNLIKLRDMSSANMKSLVSSDFYGEPMDITNIFVESGKEKQFGTKNVSGVFVPNMQPYMVATYSFTPTEIGYYYSVTCLSGTVGEFCVVSTNSVNVVASIPETEQKNFTSIATYVIAGILLLLVIVIIVLIIRRFK